MGKLKTFEVVLDHNTGVFLPGQPVAGNVVLELNDGMKMRGIYLKFRGNAKVHWTEHYRHGSGDSAWTEVRHYTSHQPYFNETIVLTGRGPGLPGEDMIHPVGHHMYPFRFTLPTNLPSSFEGGVGHIRYLIQGVIDKPWKIDDKCVRPFTVIAALDLNNEPTATHGQKGEDQKMLCCLCCASGPITAEFTIDRSGYVPGEFITISGEVDNFSNKHMSSTSVELRMETVFHAANPMYGQKTRTQKKIMSKLQKGKLEAGKSEVWSGERLYIPPLPPSLLPNCNIIQISYKVIMIVDPSGPSRDLMVPLEIMLGTVPLQRVQHVFASTPYDNSDLVPYDPFGVTPSYSLDTNLVPPPPTYAECAMGKVTMKEEDDKSNVIGEAKWAPAYTYYSYNDLTQNQT